MVRTKQPTKKEQTTTTINQQQEIPSLHYTKQEHKGELLIQHTTIEARGITIKEAIQGFKYIKKIMKISK